MKKLLILIISVVICLSVTACSQEATIKETMVVKPSEFSEETTQVIGILGDEILFFDFIVDDTVKSYSIGAFIYKDGSWQDYGSTSGIIDNVNNRIAIKSDNEGYDIHTLDDSGVMGYNSDTTYDAFDSTTQQGSYKITSTTDIIIDEEIILWCKIGNNGNGLAINNDFRNADCTAGIAFTVTFSGKGIE